MSVCHYKNCTKTEADDPTLIDYFVCDEHMTTMAFEIEGENLDKCANGCECEQ